MEKIPNHKLTELLDLIQKHNKYETFNSLLDIINETERPKNIENLNRFLKHNKEKPDFE